MKPLLSLTTLLGATWLFGSGAAVAHPGTHNHAHLETLMHFLSEPDHVAGMVFAIGLLLIVARALKIRRQARADRSSTGQ